MNFAKSGKPQLVESPPQNQKTRRHSLHNNGVREKVLGAGLCTLSNFPQTLIDQARSLTAQGKDIIHKLSPNRPPVKKRFLIADEGRDVSDSIISNHQLQSEVEKAPSRRSSPTSSVSFDASERSFNPDIFVDNSSNSLTRHGTRGAELQFEREGPEQNRMSIKTGIIEGDLERLFLEELSKRLPLFLGNIGLF